MGGQGSGSNDPKAIAALYRRVRQSAILRRIAELAGRYRRVAQSKQRLKTMHGADDMIGITLGGDINALVPSELALLALPATRIDTMRKIVERQAMVRAYQAVEPTGAGPIVVLLDESGSMRTDDKYINAKALVLALAWIARQQRRWCALIAFAGAAQQRRIVLPPGRWDQLSLMTWLEEFLGGGTDLYVRLQEMPTIYQELGAPKGKTDVVVVTDGICSIPDDTRTQFTTWKQSAQARLISLVVQSEPGDLATISDEVHLLPTLNVDEEGVGRVLSL